MWTKLRDHAVIGKSIKICLKKLPGTDVFPVRDIASILKLEAGENAIKTAQAQYSLQV